MEKDKASKEDLDLKDAEIKQKQEEQAAVDKEIGFYNDELTTLGAAPTGTPQAPSLSGTPFDKSKLPSSVLDEVVKDDVKKLLDAAHDPRLDASSVLDNHIQMQYEIIAKQLTLLRDEVGPGERLVFLELPQSIYTTPGSGDEKMAQSWWHVNGYTKTDPLVRLLLDLYDVEFRWHDIQKVQAFSNYKPVDAGTACETYGKTIQARKNAEEAHKNAEEALQKAKETCQKQGDACIKAKEALQKAEEALQKAKEMLQKAEEEEKKVNPKSEEMLEAFREFQCQYETAREKLLKSLFWQGRDTFTRIEQNGARDNSEVVAAIRSLLTIPSATEGTKDKSDGEQTAPARVIADKKRTSEDGFATSTHVDAVREALLNILGGPPPRIPNNLVKPEYDFKDGIEFVPLDGQRYGKPVSENRPILNTVRTVDIIPRQSSLNINDVQETVKATGILAAFKFLFGFAGQVNYQRQREQYEQYLHQELYASGFGKGNRDFG
jgi:tetratricopeptide (TPR) repeat protein